MSTTAKILSLSYDSAVATKTVALKSYYRSVRLLKNSGTVNPQKDSTLTNILLNGKCIDPENRKLYVFYIDTYYQASWIIEIDIDTRVQTVVYYDQLNNIGFDPLYKIYNARVVHGRLVWTDNKNPIYQIDIERAKKSFALGIGYGQYPNTEEWSAAKVGGYSIDQIVSNGNGYYKSLLNNNAGNEPRSSAGAWEDLKCLIEDAYYSMNVENFYFEPVPPKMPPEVTYQSDDNRKINNLRQTLFQVSYRYVYMDWRKSTFSPASIVPVPQAEEETATGLANEQISLNNKLQIVVNSGGEEVRAIEVIARSSDDTSKWYLIETINKFEAQGRGNEISRISEPVVVTVSLGVMDAEAVNLSISDSDILQSKLTALDATCFLSYVSTAPTGHQWTAQEYIATAPIAITISCNPHVYIRTIPSWMDIRHSSGYGLQVGMSIEHGEVITIGPIDANLNPNAEDRYGYIILETEQGDIARITVAQPVYVPPPPVPMTVSIAIHADSVAFLSLVAGSAGTSSDSDTVNMSFQVDHTGYSGEDFEIYWVGTIDGIVHGTGMFVAHDYPNGNNQSLTFDRTFNAGEVIVVTLSAVAVIGADTNADRNSISLAPLNVAGIDNSYLSVAGGSFSFAHDADSTTPQTDTITAKPDHAHLSSKPDWITILANGGYPLTIGTTVPDGAVLTMYPSEEISGGERVGENFGAVRYGNIIFTNPPFNESVNIFVSQDAAPAPPPGVPIVASLLVYPGDVSGLAISASYASGLSGQKDINWSCPITGLVGSTIYFKVFKQGTAVIQASGSFDAYNGTNTGTIVLTNDILVGDVYTIYFSSADDIAGVWDIISTPLALPYTSLTKNGFTANWNASDIATGYYIDVATDNLFENKVTGYNNLNVGNVLTYPIAGLTEGTTYYFRVRGYKSYSTSAYSNYIQVTTAVPVLPAQPSALSATGVSTSGFTANWETASGATGYYIDLVTSPDFAGARVPGYDNKDVGNVITLAITGLLPGYQYYYRIRAYNGDGTTPNSNIITVTTQSLPIPSINIDPSNINFEEGNINQLITVTLANITTWGINFPENNKVHILDQTATTVTLYSELAMDESQTLEFYASGAGGYVTTILYCRRT